MTTFQKNFYEVMWSPAPISTASHPDNPVFCRDVGSMWYVSDPFSDLEAARNYAEFRRKEDCIAEVWFVEKKKHKVE